MHHKNDSDRDVFYGDFVPVGRFHDATIAPDEFEAPTKRTGAANPFGDTLPSGRVVSAAIVQDDSPTEPNFHLPAAFKRELLKYRVKNALRATFAFRSRVLAMVNVTTLAVVVFILEGQFIQFWLIGGLAALPVTGVPILAGIVLGAYLEHFAARFARAFKRLS